MAHLIVSILLAAVFVFTGVPKVIGMAFSLRLRRAIRVSPAFWRLTGSLEIAGAVGLVAGLWFAPLGVAAASGLVLFMIGAAVARLRAARITGRGPGTGIVADGVLALVAAADVVLLLLGV